MENMTSWSHWSKAREWLSSLRLVSHPVGKCNNFWQIWCLLWKRVRDVFMCLVFLWLNLSLFFWGRHNYDVHRMDRTKTNKQMCVVRLGRLAKPVPRPSHPALCFSGSSVFGRKIIKKGKRRKSSGFRVGEQGVWITASPLKSEPKARI